MPLSPHAYGSMESADIPDDDVDHAELLTAQRWRLIGRDGFKRGVAAFRVGRNVFACHASTGEGGSLLSDGLRVPEADRLGERDRRHAGRSRQPVSAGPVRASDLQAGVWHAQRSGMGGRSLPSQGEGGHGFAKEPPGDADRRQPREGEAVPLLARARRSRVDPQRRLRPATALADSNTRNFRGGGGGQFRPRSPDGYDGPRDSRLGWGNKRGNRDRDIDNKLLNMSNL